jgi:quercetin dioxygenase-like cupin family protein
MVLATSLRHSFTYAGARLNVYHASKGEGLPMHGHEYSHATMCNAGSCKISLENGKSLVMTKATQPINLPAGIQHEIVALENDTVFVNVFADGKQS